MTIKLTSEYLCANLHLLLLQEKIFLTSTWLKKALFGNNMLIFAQMAQDRWLAKCVVLLHVLKPLHQNALYHSSPSILCENDSKRAADGVHHLVPMSRIVKLYLHSPWAFTVCCLINWAQGQLYLFLNIKAVSRGCEDWKRYKTKTIEQRVPCYGV
jgi:hypothetical protein